MKEKVIYQNDDPEVLEKAKRLPIKENPVEELKKLIKENMIAASKEVKIKRNNRRGNRIKFLKSQRRKVQFFVDEDDIFLTGGDGKKPKMPKKKFLKTEDFKNYENDQEKKKNMEDSITKEIKKREDEESDKEDEAKKISLFSEDEKKNSKSKILENDENKKNNSDQKKISNENLVSSDEEKESKNKENVKDEKESDDDSFNFDSHSHSSSSKKFSSEEDEKKKTDDKNKDDDDFNFDFGDNLHEEILIEENKKEEEIKEKKSSLVLKVIFQLISDKKYKRKQN